MATNPVIAPDVLAGFIRTAFVETYQRQIKGVHARLGGIMDFGLPSDRSEEKYAYFTAAPHPRRWPRGQEIPTKPFQDITWTVENIDWAQGIEWHANDRADDQTKSMVKRGREVADGFALLPERVFFQILTGATDADLLAAVPNAPDGAAFFATTAGGVNRFGVSGGNIVTGSGIATAQDIRGDFFNAVERFHQFQDGEGQPLWPEAVLDQGYTVLYNVANSQLVAEALVQSRTIQTIAGVAGSGENVGAAVTNVVLDSGMSLALWPTQRITDNDIFIFANGSPIKSVFQQMRQEVVESLQLPETSDIARKTKVEGIYWNARYGFGLALPYQAVQINN